MIPSHTEHSGAVAVTGATGFIGGALARRLHDHGRRVRLLVRGRGAALSRELPFATIIPGALEDGDSLARLVDGVDAVIHCAGLVRAAAEADFTRVNVDGVARLTRAAARLARPPRFILLSSLAAREPSLSPYALSKRGGEDALARDGAGLAWTVLRPPAVYGPGDRETLSFFRLYRRGIAPLPGRRGRLSLIHVDDLAGAAAALVSRPVGLGDILEVRDGRAPGYGWADLAQAASRAFGRPMTMIAPPRAGMMLLAGLDEARCTLFGGTPTLTRGKLRELYHDDWHCRDNPVAALTDWRPAITLDDGFSGTVAWYKAQGWL